MTTKRPAHADDILLGALRDLGRRDPEPEDLAASAIAVYRWRTVDAELADYDTRILTLAVLKGLLGEGSDEPVSYVNAPQLAAERGVEVKETKTSAAHDYVNLITLRGGDHAVAGSLFGLRAEARLVMVDDHTVDIPPARHMLIVRNEDRPGLIGVVGAIVGQAGVNISDMDVGRSPEGEAALMVLSTDQAVPAAVLADLRSQPGILHVDTVSG